ncbi:MAG TPA: nucleotidyltransferase domain-containing protein [Syntrophomonadaceae bacterium]|nr:nucleotidyltransferase domain-containing protein [Syntrophomonadaceae bacterium]
MKKYKDTDPKRMPINIRESYMERGGKVNLDDIIKKYAITLLITFGSYNTERFTPDSDIDIAFKSQNPLSTNDKLKLMNDLITYFKRDKIDLVDLQNANPLLLYAVACNGQVIYEEDNSFLKFKLYASFRYADTKHLRLARKRYLDSLIENLEKDIDYGTGGF